MLSDARQNLAGPVELEIEKNFSGKSVIGGFARFAITQLEKIKSDEPESLRHITKFIKLLSHYDNFEIAKREKIVQALKRFLSFGTENNLGNKNISAKPTFSNVKEDRQKLLLDTAIQMVPGVGPTRAKSFEDIGVKTVFDLLRHFPTRYVDRTKLVKISSIKTGQDVSFLAKVLDVRPPQKGKRYIQALFGDETGRVLATWFNAYHILKKLQVGKTFVVSGKAGDFGGPHMTNPDLDDSAGNVRIVPVYPATAKLQQWLISQTLKFVTDRMPQMDPGWMPESLVGKLELPSLTTSYFTIHRPKDVEAVEVAKKRVIFESLLLLETGLLIQRSLFKQQKAVKISRAKKISKEFFGSLPFTPTRSQETVRQEIAKDLESGIPMNRLLHGDVGSGKTVVGFAAAKAVMDAGFQVGWIAPTEVLAAQTYRNALKTLPGTVLHLSGSTKKADRKTILEKIKTGEPAIVIGTHAVLEDWLEFPKLALCVVDEQHRFGVMQRARLAKKGKSPHILVMSATPIPRTLAMTLYGDLDVSAITEMPAGRIPIITKIFNSESVQPYKKALAEVQKGNRVYVVCPLVEESEKLEAKSATEHFEYLKQTHFKDIPCGLLHGRMKSAEKDEVMRTFAEGAIQVLISTTVIEVGIDVSQATVMIVENAERFGLAQLHQLRGRVGRGSQQSYCFLVTDRNAQAMQILERTNNGLEVAEEDLKLRGPGDIGGTQQSGIPNLEIAPLLTPTNLPLLSLARKEAEAILEADPGLTSRENARLKEGVAKYMSERTGFAWVS
ncbi:MAG: ATP-dependent DNA helicase RecG [Caldisericia bacterium]|nr:ATP-dependent DNA helicase RecG [Caldisericia bacterium]